MYINPITAIEKGWITHPECTTLQDWHDKKFISPNAIDFPLNSLFEIKSYLNPFYISETQKVHRDRTEMQPTVCDIEGVGSEEVFSISQQSCYDAMSDMYVDVPAGVTCELIIRSTLNRNGVFLQAGQYDSAFKGNIGFVLYNISGTAFIAPGTRVGQIKFIQSDSDLKYEGGYNTTKGQHWTQAQLDLDVQSEDDELGDNND